MFRDITPNLFTTVMGTGIVANAAATLPVQFTGLRVFATIVWASAAFVLTALTAALAVHWVVHRVHARAHAAKRRPIRRKRRNWFSKFTAARGKLSRSL